MSLFLLFTNQAHSQENVSGMVDTVRFENETSLDVPDSKIDSFWEGLKSRYGNGWKFGNEEFTSKLDIEQFKDTYFDTPERQLVKEWTGLRHRRRYFSNGETKELIQLKFTPLGKKALLSAPEQTRNELKYTLTAPTIGTFAERYINQESLLRIMEPDERDLFSARMEEVGVNAKRLKPLISLNQERRRVYLRYNGEKVFTLTLDIATSEQNFVKAKFAQLDIEISELVFTASTQQKKEHWLDVQQALFKDLKTQFPYLVQNQTPKVVRMLQVIEEKGPVASFVFWYGGGVLLISLVAVIFLVVLVHQRAQNRLV